MLPQHTFTPSNGKTQNKPTRGPGRDRGQMAEGRAKQAPSGEPETGSLRPEDDGPGGCKARSSFFLA